MFDRSYRKLNTLRTAAKGAVNVPAAARSLCKGAAVKSMALFLAVSFFGMTVQATQETQQKLDAAKQLQQQTQDAISENQTGIDALNASIGQLEGEIGNLNAQLSAIAGQINALDDDIGDMEREIELTKASAQEVEEQIRVTTAQLEESERQQAAQYAAMKQRVRFLYEKGQNYYLEILFGARSLSDFLTINQYMARVSDYDVKMMEEYLLQQELIKEKQALLEKEKEQLEEDHAQLASQRDSLTGLRNQQAAKRGEVTTLLSQTKGTMQLTESEIQAAQQNAALLEQQLAEQNEQVSQLEAQLAEERRLAALSAASHWRDISQLVYDEGDRYLLANLIYCEAGNQPYEGQVAVGAVVINRVMSGAFPDTVSGVIYQKWQFEPAMTGRLALALARDDATPACYQAADAAMAGQTTVADCIFFRTPIPEITPRYVIGGHIFY